MKAPKFTVKLLTKLVSGGGLSFMENTVYDLTEYKQACPVFLIKELILFIRPGLS